MHSKQRSFWLFLIWSALIMLITGFPGNYIPKPLGFLNLLSPDKIIHLFIFAPFSFLWLKFRYLTDIQGFVKLVNYIFVMVFGIIYGSSTELLQVYVFIGRNGNIYDLIADSFGVILGVLVFNFRLKTLK